MMGGGSSVARHGRKNQRHTFFETGGYQKTIRYPGGHVQGQYSHEHDRVRILEHGARRPFERDEEHQYQQGHDPHDETLQVPGARVQPVVQAHEHHGFLHFHFLFSRYHFDSVDGRVDVTEQYHRGHERRQGRQQRVFDVFGIREPLQFDFGHELAGCPVADHRLGDLVLQVQKRLGQITCAGNVTKVKSLAREQNGVGSAASAIRRGQRSRCKAVVLPYTKKVHRDKSVTTKHLPGSPPLFSDLCLGPNVWYSGNIK